MLEPRAERTCVVLQPVYVRCAGLDDINNDGVHNETVGLALVSWSNQRAATVLVIDGGPGSGPGPRVASSVARPQCTLP